MSFEKEIKKFEEGDRLRKIGRNYFKSNIIPQTSNHATVFAIVGLLALLLILLVLVMVVTPIATNSGYNSYVIPPKNPVINVYPQVEVPQPIINVPEKEVKVNVEVRKVGDGLLLEYDDGSKKFFEVE